MAMDFANTAILTSTFTSTFMTKLAEVGCRRKFGVDDPQELLARHSWKAAVRSPSIPADAQRPDRDTSHVLRHSGAGEP
jgi:hypothetical protein